MKIINQCLVLSMLLSTTVACSSLDKLIEAQNTGSGFDTGGTTGGGTTGGNTGGGTGSDSETDTGGTGVSGDVNPPPSEVSELLNTVCDTRPEPMEISGSLDGKDYDYTEVLAEQDEGNTISAGEALDVENISGIIYVAPSTDGKVYWGARKWSLAQTQDDANKALADITITSKTDEDNLDNIVVDYPSADLPAPRYEVCLVVKAPADWVQGLYSDSGFIASVNHEGNLATASSSGYTLISDHGAGEIVALSDSGMIDISTTAEVGNISVETSSGEVDLDDQGAGELNILTDSGSIWAYAVTLSSVNIQSGSGYVDLSFSGSGAVLEQDSSITTESGSVNTSVSSSADLSFDAFTNSGEVTAPYFSGSNEVSLDVNNGGAVLTVQSDSGSINLDVTE